MKYGRGLLMLEGCFAVPVAGVLQSVQGREKSQKRRVFVEKASEAAEITVH